MKIFNCPLCRSLLQANGYLDVNAPAISHPICPVCGYPEDIAGGFPIPTRWTSLTILNRQEPIKTYAQLTQEQPAIEQTTIRLRNEDRPIYSDFSVVRGLQESAQYVGERIAEGAEGAGKAVASTAFNITLPLIILGGIVLLIIIVRK